VRSTERVLDILEAISRHPRGLTLAQASREVGIPRSTAHGVVHALLNRGYLHMTGDGTLAVGVRLLELGGLFAARMNLIKEFQFVAPRMAAECGETIQMAIVDGSEAVFVAKEDGTNPPHVSSYIGRRALAHTTGAGKAFLAALPQSELDRLYAGDELLPQATPLSISTRTALMSEIKTIRRVGYAHDNEEAYEGLQCVAAPVLGQDGSPIAAISITLLSVRATPSRLTELAGLVVRGAQEVSGRMGFSGSRVTDPATHAPGHLLFSQGQSPSAAHAIGRADAVERS